MNIDSTVLGKFEEQINEAKNILLICHTKPDADAIGAVLAMQIALESKGKTTTCCSIDPVSESYYFLPRVYLMREEFGKLEDYDLLIVLDCGDRKITGFHKQFPEIFSGKYPVINIDHHISNDNFGTLNIVDPGAASTTHMLYHMFKKLNIKITQEMAMLLLAGLYYDTGSFKHDNTTEEVLRVAAILTKYGAHPGIIAKNMFKNHSVNTLNLWGTIFENIKKNDKNIISSVISYEDLKKNKVDINSLHLSEVMNYLDSVPNTKFSILLAELKDQVKGSFRTSSDTIDVSKIAGVFNGGGHKKAAGFVMDGRLKDIEGKWEVVS